MTSDETLVELFTEGTIELCNDAGTKLMLKPDVHIDGYFGLVVEDGGGFTGMCITPRQWERIKETVDKSLEIQYRSGKLERPQ